MDENSDTRTIIYCFSGTGNSLALARMIAENLGNTEIKGIVSLENDPVIPGEYDRIGFAVPTCFSHPPQIVSVICRKLVFDPHQKVFTVVTAGGGSNHALADMERILQKGTPNKVQSFEVHLPGNHLVGFGAWPDFVQKRMFASSEKKAVKIAEMIRSETPTKRPREWPEPATGKIQAFFNEKMLGVPDITSHDNYYFTTDVCSHCGICEKICPVENIKVAPDCVQFGNNCQECMACIQWCPNRAIGHPNVPEKRKRYHHPKITLADMLELNR